jgi:predicted transposase YdaD
MVTQDALWKSIIVDLFEDMIALFYPDHLQMIDFSTVVFLDTELQSLSPNSKSGKKYADKLVKFRLKDGEERWMLIHIEVQGYIDSDFSKRMFTYFYRILDKYDIPVEALAIYSDSSKHFHPRQFSYQAFKTYNHYGFHSYKILDQDIENLRKSGNPFALAVLIARESLQKRKWEDTDLLELKRKLFRILLEKGFTKKRIEKLIHFLAHYVNLKDEGAENLFVDEVNQELKRLEGMGIVELIQEEMQNRARAKGRIEGKAEGIAEGKAKGIAEGEALGEAKKEFEMVARLFKKGFGVDQICEMFELPKESVLKVKKKIDEDASINQA